MPRISRNLASVVCLGLAVLLVAPATTQAQADTPSAFCALLTEGEVSGALKVDVTITDSTDTDCTYQSPSPTIFTALDVRLDSVALDDLRAAFPDYTDATVAGSPALISSDTSIVYVGAGQGVLTLQLVDDGSDTDWPAQLQALAAIGIGRLPSIPLPSEPPQPSLMPRPSFTTDPDLEALFPASVGGETGQVESFSGRDLATLADPETVQAISAGLATIGKTLDDMSIAFAGYSGVTVSAVRVRGADGAVLAGRLLPLMLPQVSEPQQTTITIGGKSVIKVTDGTEGVDASPHYVYAHDDVVWLIDARDPALTEIIGKLP